MIPKSALIKISPFLWEIPKTYRSDMKVSARIYTTQSMLEEIISDRSLEQLINVASLPGIKKTAIAMPDIHEGYGFPIGGIAAIELSSGIISPGGIGYDINCGVRLLVSKLTFDCLHPKLNLLARKLYENIPAGVGRAGKLRLDRKTFDEVLNEGVKWTFRHGYAQKDDLERIESGGTLPAADSLLVSEEAKGRGRDQLGTLGAGNHFVEIDKVGEIFNPDCAKTWGLFPNQIVILVHTGSRGLGHQVATDYIRKMLQALPKYHICLSDRELVYAPFSSLEGQGYFKAMQASANFAWANRQMITFEIRKVWQELLGKNSGNLSLLYDVAHNIAKIEEHQINGKPEKVIIHRKGATRAFGPENRELSGQFRTTGQPVIIPGSMGTSSFVLVGTKEAMEQTFGSSCHGAGRRMSRHQARREMEGRRLKTKLEEEGIGIFSRNIRDLAEEGPFAYKDINRVVEVVSQAGIAKKVACLKPLAVIKG